MKHPSSLRDIVESGLCVGCGLCQSVAGKHRAEMAWVDPPGRLRPRILEPLDEATEDAVLQSCPGVLLDEPLDPERHGPEATEDPSFGPYIRVWKGHAADPEIHHLGSSGGALSALGVYLIESDEIDFVYHLKADEERPMRSRSHVSTSRSDVLAGAGSRYGPSALLDRFVEQLDKGRPFAVIGKPCDISGVHNMRKLDPRVDELVKYTLAFSCGTFADLQCSRWMLERVGFPGGQDGEDNLSLFRYRGYGCPGPTRAVDKDGNVYDEAYLTFWYGKQGWTHQFRCKICADPTGEATDISVADAWPGGGPTEEEWGGYSTFISRTARGDSLIQAAIEAGVVIVEERDMALMYDVQPHQAAKKQGLNARLKAIEDSGMMGPVFRNLRLNEAQAQRDQEYYGRNYEGTRTRIEQGVSRERLA
ncbi:MAG: coenzyme F420 hydrogenase [Rhodospirillaceae bacterium]|nr:coenzyme F420 hydrogenase [Rhodospirillaceae bacterium]